MLNSFVSFLALCGSLLVCEAVIAKPITPPQNDPLQFSLSVEWLNPDLDAEYERPEPDRSRIYTINAPFSGDVSQVVIQHTPWGEPVWQIKLQTRVHDIDARSIQLRGLCASPKDGLARLLYSSDMGGADGTALNVLSVNARGEFIDKHIVYEQDYDVLNEQSSAYINCRGNQTLLSDEPFKPCVCNYENDLELDDLVSDFYSMATESIPDGLQLSGGFSTDFSAPGASHVRQSVPLDHYEVNLAPLLEELKDRNLVETEEIASSSYRLQQVTAPGLYKGWALLMVENLVTEQWRLVNVNTNNSKSQHSARLYGFKTDTAVELALCIRSCDWWGEVADVLLNLDRMQYDFQGESEYVPGGQELE